MFSDNHNLIYTIFLRVKTHTTYYFNYIYYIPFEAAEYPEGRMKPF